MTKTLLLPVHLKPLVEGVMIPFLLHMEVSYSLFTFSDQIVWYIGCVRYEGKCFYKFCAF